MCTKFVEMWDTFCMQTFCIHFVYIISDLQKVYIVDIMYTICVHDCMQNGSLINFNIF